MTAGQLSVKELFTENARFQAYLDVEVALAKAQAKLNVIPSAAASVISEKANLEKLNLKNIKEGLAKTGHPLVPLIWELDRVCGPKAGGYIHWGATTQNITQTGKLLLVKQCHDHFLVQMADLLCIFSELAFKTKNYVMAGRTHGQHAGPATFGYKIAVWLDEFIRHIDRLK